MRSLALALLLAGIVMITIGYTKIRLKCPPPRIEYRIVPRSLLNEQLYSSIANVSTMFDRQDPFFFNEGEDSAMNQTSGDAEGTTGTENERERFSSIIQ